MGHPSRKLTACATRVSRHVRAPPTGTGKSAPSTDTFHGHFVKLVPDEQVVEVLEFETADPGFRGTMTMTLTEAADGTDVLIVHEGVPDKVPAADNETGIGWHWRTSPGSSRQASTARSAAQAGPDQARERCWPGDGTEPV